MPTSALRLDTWLVAADTFQMLENLRQRVTEANLELGRSGLIKLTWGSVSGIDRVLALVVMTPAGIDYAKVRPEDLIIVDMAGKIVQGGLPPSSDMGAHLELYKGFPSIGGAVHTHSVYATMFAQAGMGIAREGMMHTDYFRDAIPLIDIPASADSATGDVAAAGRAIVAGVGDADPMTTPGALVALDGPFAWGADAMAAVGNAKALEAVAEVAFGACLLRAKFRVTDP